MPKRIQRKRTPGWRMPPNPLYVGRGSRWGNPFIIGEPSGIFDGNGGRPLGWRDQVEVLVPALSREQAIEFYRNVLKGFLKPEMFPVGPPYRDQIRHYDIWSCLHGRDLACWCPLDQPCHA